jgi:Rrf2 family protein
MKLSTRVRFGLRMMAQIALQGTQRPVLAKNIAEEQDISEAYVDQILLPLRTSGLLSSQRGRSGGYQLARTAESITVLDVVEALEGEICLVDCLEKPETCKRATRCVTRPVWTTLNKAICDCLARFTLAELRDRYRFMQTAGGEDFVI